MATGKKSSLIQFTEEVVERRLPFSPRKEYGGLCKGRLINAEIKEIDAPLEDDKGVQSTFDYAGQKIYNLVLTFEQEVTKEDPKPRYHEERFTPVVTLKKDGTPMDMKVFASLIEEQYNKLRHICNAYKELKNYPTDAGFAPGIDPEASAKERAEQFKAFYTYFLNILKGTGTEDMYKGVVLWIKVVAEYTSGKRFVFPRFVSRGYVERVVNGQKPSIYVEPNETIELTKGGTKSKVEKSLSSGETEMDEETRKILEAYSN